MSTNPSEFIEIDRTFIPVRSKPWDDSTVEESYSHLKWWMHGPSWSWDDLIRRPRVIVLGEAGSGKTSEFRQQVSKLIAKGAFAFFVRLDQIISQSLEFQFGCEELERFQQWSESIEEAYFFLDSVDEAKITRPADFHIALRRFQTSLPLDFKPRTRIFVSSRASEWHPASDGGIFIEFFGLVRPICEDFREDEPLLTTVHLAPLEWIEISRLLTARGVSDQSKFYHDLRMGDAEEFVRRPLDLLAMVDLWQQNDRLGSLTDIIEADIARKLVEMPSRSPDRLSQEDARIGVEALAAAAVLCGRPIFRLGNETIGDALDPRACLPASWDEDKYRTLLRRPIFDCASRGSIRFHHRRVREYLAASWIKARMDAGCALAELEAMLFVTIYGRRVVRRSLAPIAAWLVTGSEKWALHLRKWILEAAPGIHFQFGDAGTLPLEYKQAVIYALSEPHYQQRIPWFEPDVVSLRRFADPALDEDICRVIRNRSTSERLRLTMLTMAKLAPGKQSTKAAFGLINSGKESAQIAAAAVAVAAADRSAVNLKQLQEVATRLTGQSEEVTAALLEKLGAEQLQFDQTWNILMKTAPSPKLSDHSYSHLRHFLEHNLPREWKGQMLRRILATAGVSAAAEPLSNQRLSSLDPWLGSLLPTIVLALLHNKQLSDTEMKDIAVAMQPGRSGRFSFDERKNIDKATHNHQDLRQLLFWHYVYAQCDNKSEGAAHIKLMLPNPYTGPLELDNVLHSARCVLELIGTPSDHLPLLTLVETDLIWLNEESFSDDDNSSEYASARKFAGLVAGDLRAAVKINAANEQRHSNERRRQQQQIVRSHRRRTNKRFTSLRRMPAAIWHWLAGQHDALNAALKLYSFLWHRTVNSKKDRLTQEDSLGSFRDRIIHRFAKVYWERLALELEPASSVAVRHWRRFARGVSREKRTKYAPEINAIIAAIGIQAELEAKNFSVASLNPEDIRLITVCALHAPLWTFPEWFLTLMTQRPDDIDAALAEAIAAESAWSDEPSDILERLCKINLGLKTQTAVLAKLMDSTCRDSQSVAWAIQALLYQKQPPLAALTNLARSRSEDMSAAIKWRAIWLSVWLRTAIRPAINFIKQHPTNAGAAAIVITACARLQSDIDHFSTDGCPCWSPSEIALLLPLVYRYTAPRATCPPEVSEFDWKGASQLKDTLWKILSEDSTEAATNTLEMLSDDPSFAAFRGYILRLRNEQISRCFDLRHWRPNDIREFERAHETDPRDDFDLFCLALKRLSDIKMDVERSDTGLRAHLRAGDDERRFRIWLANELIQRSNKRYVVPQEAVIDQEQRPDLRLEHPDTAPVSIEIKWADDRSLRDLIEGLEKQLIGQYLRAHRSRCGIYVVGLLTDRQWHSAAGVRIGFQQLAEILSRKADEIVGKMSSGAKQIAVVTIDFSMKGASKEH